ncbi:hypothetical protein SKAU_G00056090 [Synaphobranchus kaupii]|uniref:Uncharacterized protein n=1 Tax=Synaphobranchus kaupii TaxID=118154 RepID=A0A9Q1J831_SYNKA|nr:hypothetical protein SKAU_G00056090 [Synaphobranchus kaupii]
MAVIWALCRDRHLFAEAHMYHWGITQLNSPCFQFSDPSQHASPDTALAVTSYNESHEHSGGRAGPHDTMKRSLQVLRYRLLSVLAILAAPAGLLSSAQELYPSRAPQESISMVKQSPFSASPLDPVAWEDGSSSGTWDTRGSRLLTGSIQPTVAFVASGSWHTSTDEATSARTNHSNSTDTATLVNAAISFDSDSPGNGLTSPHGGSEERRALSVSSARPP